MDGITEGLDLESINGSYTKSHDPAIRRQSIRQTPGWPPTWWNLRYYSTHDEGTGIDWGRYTRNKQQKTTIRVLSKDGMFFASRHGAQGSPRTPFWNQFHIIYKSHIHDVYRSLVLPKHYLLASCMPFTISISAHAPGSGNFCSSPPTPT